MPGGSATAATAATAAAVRRATAADLAVVQARVKERLESRLREFCALGLAGWAPSVPAGHPFMSWDAVGGRLVAARLV